MANELWRQRMQVGLETTPGTRVAATRIIYPNNDARLTHERESRAHRFQTASRDNVRAHTQGPSIVSGNLRMPLSADEIIEFLLMGMASGVTPSTPSGATNARLWTFKPGTALAAATIEWFDGARGWEAGGCSVDTITIAGSANGEATVDAGIVGMNITTTTITPSLTERVPSIIEGWETKLFVDAFGDTPGTTQVTGTLINWNISIANGLARKYFANNLNAASGLTIGELTVTASLTFEADSAAATAELANWNSDTGRLVRLEFGDNEEIEAGFERFVTVDIPGHWSALDIGGSDEGTRTYELQLQYVYDPTNAFGVQIRAQNGRSAAW